MQDGGAGIGCLGVELGAEGAAEWMGRQRIVFVPRDRIVAVELRRGIVGERPVLQVVVGVVAIVLGLALLSSVVGVFESTWLWMSARIAAAGAPLAMLGGYVLWSGVRPGYYLLVRTNDDARKLLFHGKIDLAEVSRVLEFAHARFGYAVEWNIQHPRPPLAPFR